MVKFETIFTILLNCQDKDNIETCKCEMDRDQLVKEIIFDKLMKMTDNKDSVRRLRVSICLQTLSKKYSFSKIFKKLKNSKNFHFQACMLDKVCPAFWTNWTEWEMCDKECGPGGRQKRVRHCQEFYTNYDSKACNGHGMMYRKCKNNKRC